MLYRLS